MQGRAATLVLVTVGLVASGCSADSGSEAEHKPPRNSPALDKKVAALEPGMSTDNVEARLGEPFDENLREVEPGITMLFYGRWRLDFEDGKLSRRIKYSPERPIRNDRGVEGQKERALDRKVLSLKPGTTSMATVRSQFGRPVTYEIVKNAPGKEVALSYEWWELTFVDGILVHRQRW